VKRLVILLSVLLAVSVVLNIVSIFAGLADKSSEPATKAEPLVNESARRSNDLRDGRRRDLERLFEKRDISELEMLRKVAAEERAVKTTEVIDRLIAERKKQLEKMAERMNERRRISGDRGDIEQLRKERDARFKERYERIKESQEQQNTATEGGS